jgi:positive regulator of sigma E activity
MASLITIFKIIFLVILIVIGIALLGIGIFQKSGESKALYILGGIAFIIIGLYVVYTLYRDRKIQREINAISLKEGLVSKQ